jgi:hypothetical protein
MEFIYSNHSTHLAILVLTTKLGQGICGEEIASEISGRYSEIRIRVTATRIMRWGSPAALAGDSRCLISYLCHSY